MNILNFKTMAIVSIEIANESGAIDLKHISVGCDENEPDEIIVAYVLDYLHLNPSSSYEVKNINRLDADQYYKILECQLKDYISK